MKASVRGLDTDGLSDPYVWGCFDNYKTFVTPCVSRTVTPEWKDFELRFNYETKFLDCLHVKTLYFAVYDANTVFKDVMLGQARINVRSLMAGPPHLILDLRLNDEITGQLEIMFEMNEICEIKISPLSAVLKTAPCGSPLPEEYKLSYYTRSYPDGVVTSAPIVTTEGLKPSGFWKSVASVWNFRRRNTNTFPRVYCGGSLYTLLNDALFVIVEVEGRVYATGNVPLEPPSTSFLGKGSEVICRTLDLFSPHSLDGQPWDAASAAISQLDICILLQNLPQSAQMPMGENRGGIVFGGKPLMEGLPLPPMATANAHDSIV